MTIIDPMKSQLLLVKSPRLLSKNHKTPHAVFQKVGVQFVVSKCIKCRWFYLDAELFVDDLFVVGSKSSREKSISPLGQSDCPWLL